MAVAYEIPHTWEEPEALHELLELVREQRSDANLRRIRYAFYVAEEAHSGQARGPFRAGARLRRTLHHPSSRGRDDLG